MPEMPNAHRYSWRELENLAENYADYSPNWGSEKWANRSWDQWLDRKADFDVAFKKLSNDEKMAVLDSNSRLHIRVEALKKMARILNGEEIQ